MSRGSWIVAALALALNGCGGGGGGGDDGPRTYAIGANIDGLVGSRLVLSNNGIPVSIAPAYKGQMSGLYSGLANGASYDITVATQPTTPAQTCVVSNGKGTIADADPNISVTCTTTPARYLLLQPTTTSTNPDRCIRASAIDAASGALAAPNGSPCAPILNAPDGPFYGGGSATGQLVVHPQGKSLYVSINQSRFGCLCAFTIDQDSGMVNFLQAQTILHPGTPTIHPSGQFVFFSSDGLQEEGHVSTYQVDSASGALTFSSSFAPDTVASIYTVSVDPLGKFVYLSFYTGTSIGVPRPPTQVMALTVDSTTGALSRRASAVTVDGALWLSPHPSGKFLYVGSRIETAGFISAFSVDSTSGALTPVARSPFAVNGSIGAAAIHPSGNYMYALDSDRILAFAINQSSGELASINGSPFPTGTNPTSLAIEPQGRFVYVSNGARVSAYAIDSANGSLTPIGGSPFAFTSEGNIAISE